VGDFFLVSVMVVFVGYTLVILLMKAMTRLWSRRLTVRTPGFHPGNRGSIPLGITMKIAQHSLGFFHDGFQRNLEPWFEDKSHAHELAQSMACGRISKGNIPLGITK
jgi:hypothetical protein